MYNLKSPTEVKEYLTNLSIEYRFGCFSEKNSEVCHLLGDYLEAIDKDYQKAAIVFKSNCDDYKYPKSCYKYGAYALLGKGMSKPNYKDAYEYFDKGCTLNNPESCLRQGLLLAYDNTARGIDYNVLKGMQLLEKACLAKNDHACYQVSGMYIAGVRKPNIKEKDVEKLSDDAFEVKKDMERAFKYTVEGCNLGNIYSCANLSRMYSRGDGVEKNDELAQKYKKIALEMQDEITTPKTLKFGQGLS